MTTAKPRLNDVFASEALEPDRPDASCRQRLGTAALAIGIYLVWVTITYLLEGSRQTLLRPEALEERLVYALAANLLAGTLLPLWALRVIARKTRATPRLAESRTAMCTAVSVTGAVLLGLFLVMPLLPVARHPLVLINVAAQILPVSVAEVVVCWVLGGAAVEAALAGRRSVVRRAVTWPVGAALFGLYHFAHSPPYDTWRMVLLLATMGLITGAYLFVSGELYGTILFHAALATVGVVGSLAEANLLSRLQTPQPSLYFTAAASLALLMALDVFWFRERPTESRADEGVH